MANKKTVVLKPGHTVPTSGQYAEVGPRGGMTGQEITGVRGKTLPPSSKPGNGFKLVDKTK